MPYPSFGDRLGALALTMACIRSAMARSDAAIVAIFSSTALSSLAAPALLRAAFSSFARSRVAARSSSVNPLPATGVEGGRLDFFAVFFAAIVSDRLVEKAPWQFYARP